MGLELKYHRLNLGFTKLKFIDLLCQFRFLYFLIAIHLHHLAFKKILRQLYFTENLLIMGYH
jgi:hypothetical protein